MSKGVLSQGETICALATAPGRAALGVVRLSGPKASLIAQTLTRKRLPPRRAVLARFYGEDGPIDQGIAIFYPSPGSYTGEDVVEFSCHGNPVILQTLLDALFSMGARQATPGEFTWRAFAAGKMDLAQAEAVADLIDAKSRRASQSALASLFGMLSSRAKALADAVFSLRAQMEAEIDFPEDIPSQEITPRLLALEEEATELYLDARRGAARQEGKVVVVAGAANAGKSTLVNLLCGEDLAIVSPIAGTTRDPVRGQAELKGMVLEVVDTAGMRQDPDPLEAMGVERAKLWLCRAQAVLWVRAPDTSEMELPPLPEGVAVIEVENKIDLAKRCPTLESRPQGHLVRLSAKTGEGLGLLRQALEEVFLQEDEEEGRFSARLRHVQALFRAREHLAQALLVLPAIDLAAYELLQAHLALGEITGEAGCEELLDEIFSRFCIGK